METAFVFPKSKKAKNRFANLMDSVDEVIIEQNKGDKVFVTSMNGRNHFWVNITNDKDWEIEFWCASSDSVHWGLTSNPLSIILDLVRDVSPFPLAWNNDYHFFPPCWWSNLQTRGGWLSQTHSQLHQCCYHRCCYCCCCCNRPGAKDCTMVSARWQRWSSASIRKGCECLLYLLPLGALWRLSWDDAILPGSTTNLPCLAGSCDSLIGVHLGAHCPLPPLIVVSVKQTDQCSPLWTFVIMVSSKAPHMHSIPLRMVGRFL